MASLSRGATLQEYSEFIDKVYGEPNDRYYTLWDMLTNIQRFSMRAMKGIRKDNPEKAETNAMIALSWYTSLMNRLRIDVGDIVWNRFPYLCSYCGERPCACKAEKVETRRNIVANGSMKPGTIDDYQKMFGAVYPPGSRTRQDAAIHLAEEVGELSEAFHIYMGDRSADHFRDVCLESADYFSCIMGLLNSLGVSCADELARLFTNNCHVCHNAPCTCTFQSTNEFRS